MKKGKKYVTFYSKLNSSVLLQRYHYPENRSGKEIEKK
jgi:hypothetical protein